MNENNKAVTTTIATENAHRRTRNSIPRRIIQVEGDDKIA